nr:hypothetical protein [Micromonospora sp. DSM 115978]
PYISIYWLTAGRQDDHMRWTVATNRRLLADGRVFLERDHVFTAFQRYLGAHYRDSAGPSSAAGPRDVHALDYPYGGLVVEVVDAPEGGDAADVAAWFATDRAPAVFAATDQVAMGLAFTPLPLPDNRMSYVKQVEGLGRRVTVLWFVESDPRQVWEAAFADAPA